MKRSRPALFLLAALACPLATAAAENTPQLDGMNWLRKAAAAAHQLNYRGIFVYQSGGRMETSRITHLVDEGGEHEKLEILDGLPREVVRTNEQVSCYLPDKNTVITEKRKNIKKFPSLLPKQLSDLTENYAVKKGKVERVAEQDAQVILLEAKDGFRYTRALWIDTETGLLLKTAVLNEKGEVVDQFAFTQIEIGGTINKEQLAPRLIVPSRATRTRGGEEGGGGHWEVTQPPPGFKKIVDLTRTLPGRTAPVDHLVYSDGLVAVSVFVEPVAQGEKATEGLSSQGAIHLYTRLLGTSKVTALGEVPPSTVKQVAYSVTPRKAKP